MHCQHLCFTDVDEVSVAMSRYRPAKIDQLSLAPFQAEVFQADFGDILLFSGLTNSSVRNQGARRDGFLHFIMPLPRESKVFIHDQPIFNYTLAGFDNSRDTHTILPGNTLFAELQISRNVFEATAQSIRRDDLDARFFRQDLIHLPQTIATYRSYLQDLVHLVQTDSPLLYTSEYQQMILGDAVPLLIDAIPRQRSTVVPSASIAHRAYLARQATDLIQANLHHPLTLRDLYTTLGISRRTLFSSFESTFGTTPMQYIKTQRLQGARRVLKQATPQTTQIAQVAHQWGYWDAGKFTKAYKAMFGELPSKTLRKA